MAEQHIQAKLINHLKQDKIQLWNPPYTSEDNKPGLQPLKELAERYAPVVCFSVEQVEEALEYVRGQAVKRGKGNRTYRETCVATLELQLPRDARKDSKKNYLETRLDVLTQSVMDRIAEIHGLQYIKLILNGKELLPEKHLNEQNVKNNSKVMVLRVSEPQKKKQMADEEDKKKTQNESVQRTQKGFQILSERDGSEDPATTPFLEIADQKGNPLNIPHSEKKALILAMGFHEKGRALLKRKQYEAALCHLLQADDQFNQCGSALLGTVDNYAVLQLDIVWCYRALEALSCLDDGRQRLQRAEDCFLKCYGERQQRLLQIKGNTGSEDVLFLRMYLLQSLLFFLDGQERDAALKLQKAEDLYSRLVTDPDLMTQLLAFGFSEREARLGLRACQGNVNQAAMHISNRRQERDEMKREEREKRRRRVEAISTLRELGYCKRDAAVALQQAEGNVDQAYQILLDSAQADQSTNNNAEEPVSQDLVEQVRTRPSEPASALPSSVCACVDFDPSCDPFQLQYLGFSREMLEAALRLVGGDIPEATRLLLDNGGVIPPELLSPSPPSSHSDEASTSTDSAGSTSVSQSLMDVDLVNEVLEDIPRHEEDYLDLTLEEEMDLIGQMKSLLNRMGS
ncbi:NEDD8 ultimate buster 1 isoform X2 [Hypomesus transpacificus]|nr:NEDD8 ultimate buster 1 isoform X2 [Hypomesus transpacificus]